MIGIYKITSPNGKIYIGQSTNIHKRKGNYRRKECKRQHHLYNSILKYGWEAHIFEVIEECSKDQLDEKEIYWGEKFEVLNRLKGLNHKLGKCGKLHEETKIKISNALKGRKVTWTGTGPKGQKYSEESKQKMRKPRVNKWERENMLSQDIVNEIREKYNTGKYTKSNLSREYKVSWGTIKNVVDKINSYKD